MNDRDENKKNNTALILIISILLSLVCGVIGGYVVTSAMPISAPVKERIVENITTSELVETSIATSVDKVYDRTVVIIAYSKGKQISTGTGFIYKIQDNKSYILTNNHVIDGATSAKIEFNDDGTQYDVNIIGGDSYSDIAVLTLDNKGLNRELKPVEVGDSSKMRLGDTIFTVGAPMGVNYKGTVTKGIISGLNRMVEVSASKTVSADFIMKVIQIDAAVNPGNSGGPLSDVSGKVIGIISLKIVQDEVEGMGFAIPIEDAIEYANVLETGKAITRPYLGISMVELEQAYVYSFAIPSKIDDGVVIVDVVQGSPAYQASLAKGDIIVKIGNKSISSVSELRYELYKYKVGDKVEFEYYRDGSLNKTYVVLGKSE